MTVSGITPLVRPVVPLHPGETLVSAARRLAEEAALPVCDQDGLVLGVLSDADVLDALVPGYLRELPHTGFIRNDPAGLLRHALAAAERTVGDIVRTDRELLRPGCSEAHAAELFIHSGVPGLPVVGPDGGLVGLLRRSDLVLALATD